MQACLLLVVRGDDFAPSVAGSSVEQVGLLHQHEIVEHLVIHAAATFLEERLLQALGQCAVVEVVNLL